MGRESRCCAETNAERPTFNAECPMGRMGRAALLDRLRQRGFGFFDRRAHAETFFVQQSPWRMPGVSWIRDATGGRFRADDFGSNQDDCRRRYHPVATRDEADAGVLSTSPNGVGAAFSSRSRCAVRRVTR